MSRYIITFGKYKGDSLFSIYAGSRSYWNWLRTNVDNDDFQQRMTEVEVIAGSNQAIISLIMIREKIDYLLEVDPDELNKPHMLKIFDRLHDILGFEVNKGKLISEDEAPEVNSSLNVNDMIDHLNRCYGADSNDKDSYKKKFDDFDDDDDYNDDFQDGLF